MALKNYYVLLGLTPDATQEEIRAAYRRLAKALHPDHYGTDSGPFLDIQEAYSVLSDPARKQAYDDLRRQETAVPRTGGRETEPLYSSSWPEPEPLIPEDEPVDLGDLSLSGSFRTYGPSRDELFERLRRNFALYRPKVERLRSLDVEVRVTPLQAYQGGRVRIMVPARLRCPTCQGRGGLGLWECWRCEGTGVVEGEYPVAVVFPPGIREGHAIQVPLTQLGIDNFYLTIVFVVSDW